MGKFLGNIISSRNSFNTLQYQHSQALKMIENSSSLYEVYNLIKKRRKLFDGLSSMIEEEKCINKEVLEVVREIMNCSCCLILKPEDKKLELVLKVGRKVEWNKIISEIELSLFTKKSITNIRDLFSYDINDHIKSCLIIPVIREHEEFTLLVFRDSTEFEEIDLQYATKISKKFCEPNLQIISSEGTKDRIGKFFLFNIQDSECLSFLDVLKEFEKKITMLVGIDSCSVFIVDQTNKVLWRKNSYLSESLIFPIVNASILGYTYNQRTLVLFPDPTKEFNDTHYYKNKFVACIPIIDNKLSDPVISVVLVSKSTAFSDYDLWLTNKYSESFGAILYMQYLERNKKFAERRKSLPVSKSKISNLNFLQLEMNSPTISKNFLEPQNNIRSIEIERTLESLLNCQEVKIISNEIYYDEEEINKAINNSRLNKKTVYLPSLQTNQDGSFLVVPLENNIVVCFRNFSRELERDYVYAIESITKLLHEPKTSQAINDKILEQARVDNLLSNWTSHLISVSNSIVKKLLACKSVIYKLACSNELKNLCAMALEIICALTNASEACIIIKEDSWYIKFTQKGLVFDFPNEEVELIEESFRKKTIRKLKVNEIEENLIIVPIMYGECFGIIILSGKKDETNRELISFNTKDENILINFAKALAQSVSEFPLPTEASLQILISHIRNSAMAFKPQTLFLAIQKAAQIIFDCDKTNFFSVSGNEMILFKKNIEEEPSQGFSLRITESIFAEFVKKGIPGYINNIYNDPKHDCEIDKITGYKTDSMLVIPIHNKNGSVGFILECINKRSGEFDSRDSETALKISKVFERVMENWEFIKKNVDEIFRLKGISNSIASYILVFNQDGKLNYANKPIERVFGISESEVNGIHFSEWLQINQELKEDIESVFANRSLKIRRTSQKIRSGKLKKFSSFSGKVVEDQSNVSIFNFRIVQLQDISSENFSGVVVILEDSSALEALHQEFREVQDQLRAITSPVAAETGLQKCIRELNYIAAQLIDQDVKDQISQVVERLKAGGLKKPKFLLNNVDNQEFQTVNSIFYMKSKSYHDSSPVITKKISTTSETAQIIPLEILRDWNLNAFVVESKYDYIYSMLSDFNAIESYQINEEVLYNFISKIQGECDKRNNPFHNFTHCFSVMHSCYMLLSSTSAGSFFSSLNILGLLIAGMCHDVDHTGRTNMFEVNSRSTLAIYYNDKSVLEQHHAAVTFEILMSEDCNIFENLSRESFREIRKIIITAIMGTDMTKHYSILTNINARAKDITTSPIGSLCKDYEKLSQFILHAADLGHSTKNYRTYEVWSLLVCQEFSDQHKDEIENGLPITEFMKDLHVPKIYYSNEIGFLNYVVRPLWECADNLLKPNVSFLLENLDRNIEEMKKKLDEWKKAES